MNVSARIGNELHKLKPIELIQPQILETLTAVINDPFGSDSGRDDLMNALHKRRNSNSKIIERASLICAMSSKEANLIV